MRTLLSCQPARLVLGAAALSSLLLAGCTRSAADSNTVAASPAGSISAAPTLTPALTAGTTSPAASSKPPASPASRTSGTISIPPNLCAATDIAQNTADAYMGALSAGNENEALACVLPHSVPAATTHSLLAQVRDTAVYLPRAGGADGPTRFDYTGNSKAITVTVTRQADGKNWVTAVAVRPA
ncbi:MAG: hypothetical protein ACR2N4_04595 [Jatrophihabitans sp.]